jgi:CheY-like chemotaxis protein
MINGLILSRWLFRHKFKIISKANNQGRGNKDMTKVLLVDDDLGIVALTRKILEKDGHEVVVAVNGKECWEKLKKYQPDLILLDIMLPDEDGWEISRKIKTDEKTKSIPIVAFTVHSSEKDKKRSFEYAHVNAQIDKPFDKEYLLKVINMFSKT